MTRMSHWVSAAERAARFAPLALFSLAVPNVSSQATEISVSGSFKIHVARKISNHPSDIDGSFTVNWKDCQWIVRSTRSDQKVDYEEDGCDGKNVYSLISMEKWIKSRSERGMQVGANTAEAEITPGIIPFNSPEINRILWLLYASSCYLSGVSAKQLPAIASYSARHTYLYYPEQPAEWQTTGTMPPLPVFVALYDDGRLRTWRDDDAGFMTGPPIEQQRRAPYDRGFTNAVLAVESFYQEGNYRIPQKATFAVYMPNPDGTNATDLKLSRTVTIASSNASFHTLITDFRPKTTGAVLVTDRRFERDKRPVYAVTYLANEHWLSDNEVRQRPEFLKSGGEQAMKISASRAVAGSSPKQTVLATRVTRWVVCSLLAITSVLGLLLILARGPRRASPQ